MTLLSDLQSRNALRVRAFQQYLHRDLQAAVRTIRGQLSLDPLDAEFLALLALCLLGLGQEQEAEQSMTQARELEPEAPLVHYLHGYFALQRRRWVEADLAFRRGIELAPEMPQAYLGLARTYLCERNVVAALSWLEQARPLLQDDELMLQEADIVAGLAGLQGLDLDAAAPHAERAVARDPENPEALALLGQVRFAQERLDEARDLVLAALQIDPNEPFCLQLFMQLRLRRFWLFWPFWKLQSWVMSGGDAPGILLFFGRFALIGVLAAICGYFELPLWLFFLSVSLLIAWPILIGLVMRLLIKRELRSVGIATDF